MSNTVDAMLPFVTHADQCTYRAMFEKYPSVPIGSNFFIARDNYQDRRGCIIYKHAYADFMGRRCNNDEADIMEFFFLCVEKIEDANQAASLLRLNRDERDDVIQHIIMHVILDIIEKPPNSYELFVPIWF